MNAQGLVLQAETPEMQRSKDGQDPKVCGWIATIGNE
jgi:hypothetical protein